MLLTFDELISGYKRSLRLIKSVDKKSYKQLLRFFRSMKKKDLKNFFFALNESISQNAKKIKCTYGLNYQISNSDGAFISYDNNYNLVIRYNINPYLSDKWILFRISPVSKNSTSGVFLEKNDSCEMIYSNYKYIYSFETMGNKIFVKISKAQKAYKEKNIKEIKKRKKQELDKYCRV